MDNKAKLQEALASGRSIQLLNDDEIKYALKPVGNAIYRHATDPNNNEIPPSLPPKKHRKGKTTNYDDKVECVICGKMYARSAVTNHRKTQYHLVHQNLTTKFRNLIISKEVSEV